MPEPSDEAAKREKRAKEVAKALAFIGCGASPSDRLEMQDVVDTYFTHAEDSDDQESGDEDDELDLEGEYSDEEGIASDDDLPPVPDTEPEPMEEGDSDMDDPDRPVVVIQPTLPAGFAILPPEQQPILNAHHGENEDTELLLAQNFVCKCTYFNNGPCSRRYTPEELRDARESMNEMTRGEQEMYILGMIRALTNKSSKTVRSKQKNMDRKRNHTKFLVEGCQVCRVTFCFMYRMSKKKLTNLQKWYKTNRMTPYLRKAGGRVVSRRLLSYEDISRAYSFICNYAEDHAIALPGRVPGFKRGDVKLLPCSTTKDAIFKLYVAAMAETEHRCMKYTSFKNVWLRLCPNIIRCKPATDLCWVCQQNQAIVSMSSNLPENEKAERCRNQLNHLAHVDEERELYRQMVKDAGAVGETTELKLTSDSASKKRGAVKEMHYSFDFAQQVHIPANPLQPGPIYFLTPRKCGIFGVCCEGVRQQVNYLVDEGMCSGKGSNSVISYLHHFLNNYSLGEDSLTLHCDNCSGQNKNRYMLWYCMWRTLTKKHHSVTLNFMVSGHTKFAPDGNFGILKRRFARSTVECLDDMEEVVSSSGVCNIAQLVGDEQQNVAVPTYNWQDFFGNSYRPLPGIKSYHHFRFTQDEPGVVFAKKRVQDPETRLQLVKPSAREPPQDIDDSFAIPPPGLNLDRQWYLYNSIREYCLNDDAKNKTCPRPIGH
ncbi:uncharacterized protein [Amphiura filiformis]|uniref:uncharacterized protein n=1 Tax=Amphiura filiformis TaxID=82378 RepID=UPI003B217241